MTALCDMDSLYLLISVLKKEQASSIGLLMITRSEQDFISVLVWVISFYEKIQFMLSETGFSQIEQI